MLPAPPQPGATRDALLALSDAGLIAPSSIMSVLCDTPTASRLQSTLTRATWLNCSISVELIAVSVAAAVAERQP